MHRQKKSLKNSEISLKKTQFLTPELKRLSSLGLNLFKKEELEKAKNYFNQILAIDENNIEAIKLLGVIALKQKDNNESLKHFSKLVLIEPNNAENHFNLGICLHETNSLDDALCFYESALSIDKNYLAALENKAAALREQMKYQEAIKTYEEIINRDPGKLQSYINYAISLTDFDEFEAALEMYNIAIDMGAKNVLFNKAGILMSLCKDEEAIKYFLLAQEFYEKQVDIDWNLSNIYLRAGNFKKGWEKYESRLGYGDTIQFCRYLEQVKKFGCKTIFVIQRELINVLSNIPGVDTLIAADEPIPDHDFYCTLLSLPFYLKTDEHNIPAKKRYIHSDPSKSEKFSHSFKNKNKLKVGIVWSGSIDAHRPNEYNRNRRRNLPINYLKEFENLDIEFYSLQKGKDAEKELEEFLKQNPNINIINIMDRVLDFSDTAGLIENLDLVISVDTSTAHLAAAMGKETWLLNRLDSCWRWQLDRSDSPWYPTLKIFRQSNLNDWNPVIQQVKYSLVHFSKQS